MWPQGQSKQNRSPNQSGCRRDMQTFLLTHLNLSFLRSSSSCSACFLLWDRKKNTFRSIFFGSYFVKARVDFWGLPVSNKKGARRHCWQRTKVTGTFAPQSSAASRSSSCLSPRRPSVPLELSLFQGAASPLVFFSSPLLSALPLHANGTQRWNCIYICQGYLATRQTSGMKSVRVE